MWIGGEKMRIIHINDEYKRIGGTESYMYSVSEGLNNLGHKSYIIAFGDKIELVQDSRIKVIQEDKFRPIKIWNRFLFNPRVYFQLRKLIKDINPDIIHFHNINNKYTFTVWMACKGYKISQHAHDYALVCLTGWGSYNDNLAPCLKGYGIRCVTRKCIPSYWLPFFYPFAKIRDMFIKKYSTHIIAPSQRLKNILDINGFMNVKHLPYFITYNFKPGIIKKDYILYVGRISKEKGIKCLIEAMKDVSKKYPDLKLIIIGDGNQKQELVDYISENDIKNIIFKDNMSQKELEKYYQEAKILIVPSIWSEQFGMVGIESMACGTPCIASDVGGISEWCINGSNGFLVEPGNVSELINKISILLDDDRLRDKFSRNGLKLIQEKHLRENHINKLLELYNDKKNI